MIERPEPTEYHAYYQSYIALVPDGDVLDTLRASARETTALLRGLSDERAGHRYAPGKWSVKEVLAHLTDTERAFAFRAFWFARNGPGELGSIDPDPFVAESFAARRSIGSLVAEFEAVRAASLALFGSLAPETLTRSGIASGNRFSVRTFPYLTAGHELHHRALLRDRYGLGG
jgi:hypothetical protein